jgi:DNA-binding transcriptional ArsR family regulator
VDQDNPDTEQTDYHTIDGTIADQLDNSLPAFEVLDELVSELKMVANPTRLQILGFLAQRDLCVHDLTALLDLSQSAISHQLQKLRDRGLLNRHKDGRVVYYSLDNEKLQDLFNQLTEFFN